MNFIDKLIITRILNKYKKKLAKDLDKAKFDYSVACTDTDEQFDRICYVRDTYDDRIKGIDKLITDINNYKRY